MNKFSFTPPPAPENIKLADIYKMRTDPLQTLLDIRKVVLQISL